MSLDVRSLYTSKLSIYTPASLCLASIFNRNLRIRKLNNLLVNLWFFIRAWNLLLFPAILLFLISGVLAWLSIIFFFALLNILWCRPARCLVLQAFDDMLNFVSVSWALILRSRWKGVSKVCRLLYLVKLLFSRSRALERWLVLLFLKDYHSVTPNQLLHVQGWLIWPRHIKTFAHLTGLFHDDWLIDLHHRIVRRNILYRLLKIYFWVLVILILIWTNFFLKKAKLILLMIRLVHIVVIHVWCIHSKIQLFFSIYCQF